MLLCTTELHSLEEMISETPMVYKLYIQTISYENSGTVQDNVAVCHRPARELFNRQSMMNESDQHRSVRAHPHMRQDCEVASVPICLCPLMALCNLALEIETKHENNLQIYLLKTSVAYYLKLVTFSSSKTHSFQVSSLIMFVQISSRTGALARTSITFVPLNHIFLAIQEE